eukprot:TRINITY_DN4759_c0_g1_i1.p1 TRINITY_DN4759_c0_g1~~TRINITY_DN4759_c0_g1_i1.p1  ORF type:complete len:337 (-),score=69.07 TRINITY_DN4759_c0_g1_i1:206-1216(-)
MNTLEKKFFETSMPEYLTKLERMEETRIQANKTCLERAIKTQDLIIPDPSLLESMARSAESIEPQEDIRRFLFENKSHREKPLGTEYEPFNQTVRACVPQSANNTLSSICQLNTILSNQPGATISPGTIPPHLAATLLNNPALTAPQTTSPASYQLQHAASTPAQAYPTVAYTQPAHVPAPVPSLAPAHVPGPQSFGTAVAIYDYQATEQRELSFYKSERISVTKKDPTGWWTGYIISDPSRKGLFPSNYTTEEPAYSPPPPVTRENKPQSSAPTPAAPQEQCQVLYDYNAESSTELSIIAGEILSILKLDNDGWYQGFNSSRQFGRFPSNFVQKI